MSMLNEAQRGSLSDGRDRSLKGRIKELIPWKGDEPKEIIRKIVFLAATAALIYWCYTAYIYFFGSKTMIKDQQHLSDLFEAPPAVTDSTGVTEPNPTVTEPVGEQGGEQTAPPSKYPAGMLSRFESLYDINPDIVGWIKIDGLYVDDKAPEDELTLAVNYPVLQSDDNDYYLAHDFYGSTKDYGSIYADYRADLSADSRSDNVTLYGHDMATGYYFARLHKYNDRSDAEFVSEHRVIDFYSLFSEDRYIIFACFLTGIYEDDDNQPLFRYHSTVDFDDIADFDYWYKNVMYRNYYITDIDCNMDDEYLTLSTCSYEISDSRFVVVARKLREGEDPSVYTYSSNPKKHLPKKFLEVFNPDAITDDGGPDYEYYIPEES